MKDGDSDQQPTPHAGTADPDGSGVIARFEDAAGAHAEDLETRAAVAGDAASLDRLWKKHRRWVAAILLAHKPRWADLDDLLQDVAVSVVRKVGELRDPRAVRPWLRTVAINAAHASGRSGARRAKDVSLTDDDPLDATPAPDNAQPARDLADGRRLLDLSRKLPDGYREPLLLKAVQNLSYREIGRILGLPETTIETRIARGRRMLRELAAGEMPDRLIGAEESPET